jgi:hypothetical protein
MTYLISIIAFLLGRLRLTIPECLVEYRNLSSSILRNRSPVPPLFDNSKLVDVADKIVRKYSPTQPTLCKSDVDSAVKTYETFLSALFSFFGLVF